MSRNFTVCYYDADWRPVYGCPPHARNVSDLLEEMTWSIPLSYARLRDTKHRDIPGTFETLYMSLRSDVKYGESMGSVLFGIAKSLATDLFSATVTDPRLGAFLLPLAFLDYADTTFGTLAVRVTLRWERDGLPEDVRVTVDMLTKGESYLSERYRAAGVRPFVARYVVVIGESSRGGD